MANKSAFVDNITPYLKDVQGRKIQLTIIMRKISLDMKTVIRKRFSESKDLHGKSWPAIKNASKKRGGKTSKPLVDNGERGGLKGSITVRHGLTFAQAGTNKKYAKVHDKGFSGSVNKTSKKGKKFVANMNIPQRRFSGINRHQKKKYKNMIINFIMYGK